MTQSLLWIVMAVLVGVGVPPLLARQAWLDICPRIGIAVWLAALSSTVTALATGAAALALGSPSLRDAAADLLRACVTTLHERVGNHPAVSLAALTLMTLGGVCLATHLLRHWLLRRRFLTRHREALDLVSRSDPRWGVWIVNHPTPTAYSLPGRGGSCSAAP